ncbi:MAG: response regulator transcription factor [Chloroflexus sp.]|jgi:DNA-binding NarL/FixJ family response regulator|uniref:response regulator transcription factor n=1 Tax=unclassified Chloroflexus TaxID=2633855 RepID=UPI0004DF82E8|nr:MULTISPECIES: response regulator transcription factor [unclassified Chloroflexus]MBO9313026.1 response regulator transcription factor [Chloroflexus sp.]MBO9314237.1 response regulator transcription factor [Chloroflexus sp.]MBO9318477.1 response regulator transcription factor [Chloroflexus sp.]MBO9338702.1 response regulator transcription factor [Chloroflexus sp.]MBO9346766.1 response regulator transcription factor [Chloroflexus sp.]
MSKPITILLADDHTMFRQGLREILERKGGFQVVAEVRDGAAAVEAAKTTSPDIALLDVSMPVMTGIEAARQIAQVSPQTRCVVLTMHRDEQTVLEALRAGANAYLLKDADATELIEAIHVVHRGEAALAGSAAARVLELLRRNDTMPALNEVLTPRERDILALVAQGDDNRAIALKLSLAEKTVGNRLSEIFQKLGVSNRTQAAIVAVQRGLVPPPELR